MLKRAHLILLIGFSFAGAAFPGSASASQAFQLQVTSNDSVQNSAALHRFIEDIQAALPQKLKDAFDKPIQIEFKKLGDAGFGPPPCPGDAAAESPEHGGGPNYRYGLEPVTLPWQSQYTVELNEGFLPEIAKGPEGATRYSCGHGNLYRLAVATAIHEIAHHYDALNIDVTPEALERRSACEIVMVDSEMRDTDQGKQCAAYLYSGTTVSGRPDFQALMGFLDSPEHINPRSPDTYEYKNARESFAVNMEFFTLDPQFGCRRPSVYRFLAHHFGITTKPSCVPNRKVVVTSYEPKNWRVVDLDPKRIYAIHYLLADQGSDAMSRFGHSMFRIIYCSPSRAQVGPDCLKDVDWHFVVSFRANVRGLTIDKIQGLTGKYPSQLFLLRFLDVINEYTLGESRKVLSYPLNFTREQISSIAEQIVEEFWQYENRYFFVSNNCATESLNLLRAALPEHTLNTDGRAFTPKGLRKTLFEERFLETDALSSDNSVGENAVGRYVFPSLFESAKESFGKLAAIGLPGSAGDLEHFLGLSATERRQVDQEMIHAHPAQSHTICALFLELELLCRTRAAAAMEKHGASLAMEDDFKGIMDIQESLLPWNLAKQGYGIPLASEMPDLKQVGAMLIELSRQSQLNLERIRSRLTSDQQEYDECSKNVKWLITALRQP
jgi:hypothetical protein